MNFLNPSFLFASMIWSSVGVGYFIYGKRQQSFVPLVAGIIMIAVSCFVPSAVWMSVTCVGLIALVYLLLKQGL